MYVQADVNISLFVLLAQHAKAVALSPGSSTSANYLKKFSERPNRSDPGYGIKVRQLRQSV